MKIAIILKAPVFNDVVTEDTVIYADAAYKFADKIGAKKVLAVVGDFDSLGSAPKGENVIGLQVEKNFTDGERALRYAVENGFDDITVYGAYGGKIEHILGNIALLKIAKNLGVKARIKDGATITELICGKTQVALKKGCKVSLLPYGGDCVFLKSRGLYYPLDRLTLTVSDTRGISNVAEEDSVYIEIKSGESLIVYEK